MIELLIESQPISEMKLQFYIEQLSFTEFYDYNKLADLNLYLQLFLNLNLQLCSIAYNQITHPLISILMKFNKQINVQFYTENAEIIKKYFK